SLPYIVRDVYYTSTRCAKYNQGETMPQIIGENLDKLTTLEIKAGTGNLPRGVVKQLYDAERSRTNEPLTYSMASALLDAVGTNDNVLIITGAGGPPGLPNAEIDGIPGAVAIARALQITKNANATVITEKRATAPRVAAIKSVGMNPRRR